MLIYSRNAGSVMTLKRGFRCRRARVLVVEDVVSGRQRREAIELVRSLGGEPVGVGSIVDHSNGAVDFGIPFHAVLSMEFVTYPPEDAVQTGSWRKPGGRGSGHPAVIVYERAGVYRRLY